MATGTEAGVGTYTKLRSGEWGVRTETPNVVAGHADGCDVYWEDTWSDEHGRRPCSCGRQAEIDAAHAAFEALLTRSGGLVRWVDGRGEVPFDPDEPLGVDAYTGEESPCTWGDLLALVTPEHWARAEQERDRMGGMVVVPCAWARRARFYGA